MPVSYELNYERSKVLEKLNTFAGMLRETVLIEVENGHHQAEFQKLYRKMSHGIHSYLLKAFKSSGVANRITPYEPQTAWEWDEYENNHRHTVRNIRDDLTALENIVGAVSGTLPLSEKSPFSVDQVLAALSEFQDCVRYLKTRRSDPLIEIEDEGDVQDLIYLMLRPWITDLTEESPTEKSGNRYTIKDFHSKKVKVVIEAKMVRSKSHNIEAEINDDIANYPSPDFDTLIFFVYDPKPFIRDSRKFREFVEGEREIKGKKVKCYLVAAP